MIMETLNCINNYCIAQKFDGEKLYHSQNSDKQNFDELLVACKGEALR